VRFLYFFLSLFCIFTSAHAQFSGHYNALNITGTTNTLKSEIPLAQPSVTGSTYLDDDWQPAEIVLKDGNVISELPVRVEIEQGNVEIQYKGEVKFLNLARVDSLTLVDRTTQSSVMVVKAAAFVVDGVPLQGIAMVHSGKQYNVVKHLYIEFLPSNYNVAMDVGSKDHRKVKKERLYLAKGSDIVLMKGSNKKILKQLHLENANTLEIIRQEKLNLTNESDLIRFVDLM
jgi:hypothetical protein